MWLPVATIGSAMLLAFLFSYWINGKQKKKKRQKITGSKRFSASSDNVPQIAASVGIYQFIRDMQTECGTVAEYCVEPDRITSTATPTAWNPQIKLFDKPENNMEFIAPIFGTNNIHFINEEEANTRRDIYDSLFMKHLLEDYFHVFLENVSELAEKWSSLPQESAISLHEYMYQISCKSVGITMFGDFFRDNTNVQDFLDLYKKLWSFLGEKITDDLSEKGSAERQEFDTVVKEVHAFCHRIKASREKAGDRRFADAVIETGLDATTVIGDMLVYLVGGFHSTSIVLTWCIYFAAKYRNIQDKIYSETKDVLGEEDPSESMLPQLKFLRQFVTETLRIGFVAPVTGKGPDNYMGLCGFHLPKRKQLIQALGTAMMDSQICPEPERFDPDRFSSEASAGRSHLAFCAFGFSGKRMCPGQEFFYMEAVVTLAYLFRKFYMFLADDRDIGIEHGFLVTPTDNVYVKIQKR